MGMDRNFNHETPKRCDYIPDHHDGIQTQKLLYEWWPKATGPYPHKFMGRKPGNSATARAVTATATLFTNDG